MMGIEVEEDKLSVESRGPSKDKTYQGRHSILVPF